MFFEEYFNNYLDVNHSNLGIHRRLLFIKRIESLITILGLVFFVIAVVGFFYSIDVVYNLSPTQKIYNDVASKVDSTQIIKPSNNIFLNEYVIGNYFLFIPSLIIAAISLLAIYLGTFVAKLINSFICPICYTRILVNNIQDYTCPICKEDGLNYIDFINGCPHCKETMKYYGCPHCDKPIDLEAPYNEKELKRRRYAKVRG